MYGVKPESMGYRVNDQPPITPAISTHIRAIRKSYQKDRKVLRVTFVKMDMFGPPVYPSIYDLPFVDHLHERPHPQHNLIQFLTHQKSNPRPLPTQPDVDIRDTSEEYVIEMELPGLTDKKAIKIEWTSSRSLLITGHIDRPFVEDEKPEPPPSPEATSDQTPLKPTLVVAERKIGQFRRHFNFPVEVEMTQLKAWLEGGLLSIRLPKKQLTAEDRGVVAIE